MEETGRIHGGRRKDASLGVCHLRDYVQNNFGSALARQKSTRDCGTSIYLHGKVKCRRE